jgi:hypothetical protein
LAFDDPGTLTFFDGGADVVIADAKVPELPPRRQEPPVSFAAVAHVLDHQKLNKATPI